MSAIDSAINHNLQLCEDLIIVLEKEKRELGKTKPDKLDTIREQKSALTAQVKESQQALLKILGDHNPDEFTGVTRDLWLKLQSTRATCREKNEINGAIINGLLSRNNELLAAMQGFKNPVNNSLYGPDLKSKSLQTSQFHDKA